MPGGENCVIPGCHTQRGKCRGLSFHHLPKLEKHQEWRAALIRAIDREFYNPQRVTICSRHFKDICFRTSLSGKRFLIPGSLPTEMMPTKYVVTLKPPPRKDWLSKTEEDEKSLKPSSKCKRTNKHLFLGKCRGQDTRKKLLLAPVVQQSESDFPKTSLKIIKSEENPDTEVKQEVSSDLEEGAEQRESHAMKKEAESELMAPHCFPHQRTVKNGISSSEVRLLQPKCEPQSPNTLEYSQYSVTDSQYHHINVINPAYIKKEPEDFEPVKQIGYHSPEINTRAKILKLKSEEIPFLNMLHPDSIKKEPEDFETSRNVEKAANTTHCSFESKVETEIYPTGLYHNVHYAQLKSSVDASDSVNEVSCAGYASNHCTPSLHEIKARDDANKHLCHL